MKRLGHGSGSRHPKQNLSQNLRRLEKKKKAKTTAVKLDDAVKQEYEEVLARIDNYDGPQLGELITKYDLKNPETGVQPGAPVAFNLMFQTSIGPSSNLSGYLRPETAQGQFLNFAKLLEYNQSSMPFASASIGKSYRNEISPRAGLLRGREFVMKDLYTFDYSLTEAMKTYDAVKKAYTQLFNELNNCIKNINDDTNFIIH